MSVHLNKWQTHTFILLTIPAGKSSVTCLHLEHGTSWQLAGRTKLAGQADFWKVKPGRPANV